MKNSHQHSYKDGVARAYGCPNPRKIFLVFRLPACQVPPAIVNVSFYTYLQCIYGSDLTGGGELLAMQPFILFLITPAVMD